MDVETAKRQEFIFPLAVEKSSSDLCYGNAARIDDSGGQSWLQLKSFKVVNKQDDGAGSKYHNAAFSSDSDSDVDEQAMAELLDQQASYIKRSKRKKKKRKKDDSKSVDSHTAVEKQKPKTVWLEEASRRTGDPFRLDRQKDPDNLQFNTLYRLDVARFNVRFFNCVGLKQSRWTKNPYKRKIRKKLKQVTSIRYHSDGTGSGGKLEETIVPSKVDACTMSEFIKLGDDSVIRPSNESKVKADVPLEKDPRSVLTEEFNIYLRSNPHDISEWLKFTHFQQVAVKSAQENVSDSLMSSYLGIHAGSKIVIEKQVAILERALEMNPKSLELLTRYMELCKDICDGPTYTKKWKSVIFKQPNNVELWRQFLLTNQSYFADFTVGKCMTEYRKCFNTLVSIQNGVIVSHPPKEDFVDCLMAVFLQHCLFLCQAGHTEKAIASFQALVEFTCFCPKEFRASDLTTRKQLFQCYCDSEFPRIGDSKTSGWDAWYITCKGNKDKTKSTYDDCETKEEVLDLNLDAADKSLDKTAAWLKLEGSRGDTQFKPFRAASQEGDANEEECDDPDRIVLFDDISYVLFHIPDDELQKFQVLLMFLGFLGLPIPGELFVPQIRAVFCQMEERLIYPTFSAELNWKLFGTGAVVMSRFLGRSEEGTETYGATTAGLTFIRNALQHMITSVESAYIVQQISDIWMKFELLQFVGMSQQASKGERKLKRRQLQDTCKSILAVAHNRTCLHLWTTYSIVELQCGKEASARKVLLMALGANERGTRSTSSSDSSHASSFRTFLEMELGLMSFATCLPWSDDQKHLGLAILASMASDVPLPGSFPVGAPSPAKLLKARSDFSSKTKELLSAIGEQQITGSQTVDWVCCYAVFEFLYTDWKTSLEVINHAMTVFADKGDVIPLEQKGVLTAYKIQLLRRCSSLGYCHHRDVQLVLSESLGMYVGVSWLASLFLECTDNFLYSLETRRLFEQCLAERPSPWLWWLAISYEKMKHKKLVTVAYLGDSSLTDGDHVGEGFIATTLPRTGIVQRIRSLYTRATECQRSRYCLSLWRHFIQFEMSLGDSSRAKKVYYRAIQSCPWSKELFLDAIRMFDGSLESTVDLMQEKEIRVRLPIEEFELLWSE